MINFDYFLKRGNVRKVSPDYELGKFLIKDMNERVEASFSLDEKFPKLIFENIYDGLRDFCDALLAIGGYKSYSHQASISYLKKQGFTDIDVQELDKLRYKRNGSKYYGKKIAKEDAEEIKEFYNSIKDKIKRLIKEKGLE